MSPASEAGAHTAAQSAVICSKCFFVFFVFLLNVTRVPVQQKGPQQQNLSPLSDADQMNISRADGKKKIPQSASDRFNVFLPGLYFTHARSLCTFIARKLLLILKSILYQVL